MLARSGSSGGSQAKGKNAAGPRGESRIRCVGRRQLSGRFFGDLLPARARLGPLNRRLLLRSACDRRFCRDRFRRGNHPTGWHGGFPIGRPWVLALVALEVRTSVRTDGQPMLRFPDPFLGSGAPRIPSPARSAALGPMPRILGVSHPAVRGTTGGDSNPDRPLAFWRQSVWGGLVAGRRSPPRPHSIASRGQSVKTGLRHGSLFQFRRPLPWPTTEGNIRLVRGIPQKKSSCPERLSTAARNYRIHRNQRGV